jgi:hypothetical protein
LHVKGRVLVLKFGDFVAMLLFKVCTKRLVVNMAGLMLLLLLWLA